MSNDGTLDKNTIRMEYENTDISLKDLAEKHSVNYQTIKSWKSREKWVKVATQTKEVATEEKRLQPKKGAPPGNKNAVGNSGGAPTGNKNAVGHGAPPRNSNAVSHGLFRNFLPEDDETRQIYDAVGTVSPIDLLWENIQIKFTAILRAQKIMWVRDQNDETKVLKKHKQQNDISEVGEGEHSRLEVTPLFVEEEWEYQFAWDKQATFLNAQSRAMSTLTSMIGKYEEMCRLGWGDDEQKLRIEKMKLEIDQIKNGGGDSEDDLIEDWVSGVVGNEEEGIAGDEAEAPGV